MIHQLCQTKIVSLINLETIENLKGLNVFGKLVKQKPA